jgi:hypothetical protein
MCNNGFSLSFSRSLSFVFVLIISFRCLATLPCDEFVLIGSANINQRSLEGTRDTEIAMGGYQPHHSWAKKGSRPRGQVNKTFRDFYFSI